MALVVNTTLAPAATIFAIFSFVMSASRWRMDSSCAGSVTSTCTPSCIRWRCRLKSSSAMRAPATTRGICWLTRVAGSAKPRTSCDSCADLPCDFTIWMLEMGYFAPSAVSRFTDSTASTASWEKNSAFCEPRIFEDMDVRAAATRNSRSILSVDTVRCDLMYFTDSFTAKR